VVAQGPKPPADGAWVGAWVKPAAPNQAARVAAVASFEQAIGRKLDLVNVYHPWTEKFPSVADFQFVQQGKVLMISWASTDISSILSGADDQLITDRATALKALGAPVLLRWRWEMNRPNLAGAVGSAADYVAAWKHLRSVFAAVGATNVGWVWCPIATDFNATNGPSYYPGDDQVDWLCTDVYPGPANGSFASVASEFMAWAASHHKPVVIGEYGVESSNANQAQWIAGAQAYARQTPHIKAMAYFDADRVENGVTRDFRLEGTTAPLAAFKAMVQSPYFTQPKP
jgi:beta-mannanase